MNRSRVVKSHNHSSFDVKPLGECPSCDNYHEGVGVTGEQIEAALLTAKGVQALTLLAMLGRVDPEKHAEWLGLLKQDMQIAEAVDEVMGEWPDESRRSTPYE
jgi:hypothetical protein